MESYEINMSTLMIMPEGYGSRIIEIDNEFYVDEPPPKVMEQNCRMYGSSLLGRIEGTKTLIGINYKAPIILSEINKLVFFPTGSTKSNNCIWISLHNLEKYLKNKEKTTVIFSNQKSYDIPISYYIIENQVFKTTMLESKLNKIALKK